MTLQDKIINTAIEILSAPQVPGKIRMFGIETDHEVTHAELLTFIMPDGVDLYSINGKQQFQIKGKSSWVVYLLSKEDLELTKGF